MLKDTSKAVKNELARRMEQRRKLNDAQEKGEKDKKSKDKDKDKDKEKDVPQIGRAHV